MRVYQRLCLVLILGFLILPGCAWNSWSRKNEQLPPPAFAGEPTFEDIAYAVNANTDRVRQLQTQGAKLTIEGVPKSLQADLVLERPHRFRMKAELFQFTGRELDVGSNDELFWMWIRRNPDQALYFARHTQFASSPARQLVAVDPLWLVEAIGLPEISLEAEHEGPLPAGDDRIQIHSRMVTENGPVIRVMILDKQYGFILEQHLYDARGQLVASVQADEHRFYADQSVTLPHKFNIQLAPNQPNRLSFQLSVSQFAVNEIYGEPSQLWSRPEIEGVRPVDLADPGFSLSQVAPVPNQLATPQYWSAQQRPPAYDARAFR